MDKYKNHQFNILLVFILISVIVASAISFYNQEKAIETYSIEFVGNSAKRLESDVENYISPAVDAMTIYRSKDRQVIERLLSPEALETFGRALLEEFDQISALNYGDFSGNFFMVKREEQGGFLVKQIKRSLEVPVTTWHYYDQEGTLIEKQVVTETVDYDPRTRPWFIGAAQQEDIYWSELYIFFTDQVLGTTVGQPVYRGTEMIGVVSIDISIDTLSTFAKDLKVTPNSDAIIYNQLNQVVAYSNEMSLINGSSLTQTPIVLRNFPDVIIKELALESFGLQLEPKGKAIGSDNYWYVERLVAPKYNTDWRIGVSVPEGDFAAGLRRSTYITLFVIILVLFITLLLYDYRTRELRKTSQLEQLAAIDQLTRIGNRHAFNHVFEEHQKGKEDLCIILGDIDYFKEINDAYGHNVGDELLLMVAEFLQQKAPVNTEVFRWGGEEFLVLLYGYHEQEACHIAESLRKGIEALVYQHKEGEISLTMSLGVAKYQEKEDVKEVVNRADKNLYRAKMYGKNQVFCNFSDEG